MGWPSVLGPTCLASKGDLASTGVLGTGFWRSPLLGQAGLAFGLGWSTVLGWTALGCACWLGKPALLGRTTLGWTPLGSACRLGRSALLGATTSLVGFPIG